MSDSTLQNMPVLSCSAEAIIQAVLPRERRVLLFGPPGLGKSTLTTALGRALNAQGRACCCISADPGSPGFGVPGAITLGRWENDDWHVEDFTALCTLDAGRFRLPLIAAVRRLAQAVSEGILFIDGPGVVRGIAGKELLVALVDATNADVVLALSAMERQPPLLDELRALAVEVFFVNAAPEAKRPGKRVRARRRTAQWEAYLADAVEHSIDLRHINLTGTPPPVEEASVWSGRQVGLLQHNRSVAMGEVLHLQDNLLTVLLPPGTASGDTLLVRDALRTSEGVIETAEPFLSEALGYLPAADVIPPPEESGGPRVAGRVGHVDVGLLNGVFGDPQIHLRMRHQRRSLMFDLGDGARLPARLAHQVSDVFISHAHMDHISGFQWLLRSRLRNALPVCRVYGPLGLLNHIQGFIQSYLWDRIGDSGPVFEIAELHGDQLQRYQLKVGIPGVQPLETKQIIDGVLRQEPGFRIRTAVLDHHTPVMAYAYEPDKEINVRKDRLTARGLTPGPWLATLKQQLLAGQRETLITLPDGNTQPAGTLGDELVFIKPGKKLVYATDLADTRQNRNRLTALAHHAHTFFCEAPFLEADAQQAQLTGHLTTRACGEIATAAGVVRLVPFHFSRRYSDDPQQLYEEINAACGCVVMPRTMQLFMKGQHSGEIAISAEENVER